MIKKKTKLSIFALLILLVPCFSVGDNKLANNVRDPISSSPSIPTFNHIPDLPNRILVQAEDYVDCYDTTVDGNDGVLGGFYRTGPGFDADISQNFYYYKNSAEYVMTPSYKISDIISNEWLEYNINIEVTDSYKLIVRLCGDEYNYYHIELDNVDVTGSLTFIPTGNSETWWDDFETSPISISSGQHTLKMVFDTITVERSLAFDYIIIESVTNVPEPIQDSDFTINYGPEPVTPVDYIKPVSIYGNLHVDGSQIVGENNEPIQLRGFGTHGPQWLPLIPKYTIPNLAYLWKVNLVRLTIYITEGIAWLNTQMRPVIDRITEDLIQDCIDAGIYVIIDFHQHAHIEEITQNVGDAMEFFEYYASRYGNVPNVLFEILNEPQDPVKVPWSQAKIYADQVIPIVRAYSDNIVLVGTPQYCQLPDEAIANPINDPNVVYTFHVYASSHGTVFMQNVINAMNAGLCIMANEFSTGYYDPYAGGEINETAGQQYIDFFETNHIGWIAWSFNYKNEPLSMLRSNQYLAAGFWLNDGQLTQIGKFFRKNLGVEPNGVAPDVNHDGSVDIVDALLISQYYMNLDPQPFDPLVADCNEDGSVDIVDALLIELYYNGVREAWW